MSSSADRFSRRYRLRRSTQGKPVYHEAPERVRVAILEFVHSKMKMTPTCIRDVICEVRRVRPDSDNWSEYPNIWDEAQGHVYSAEWFEFFDFIEELAEILKSNGELHDFEANVNRILEEENIGWRLTDGVLLVNDGDSIVAIDGTLETALEESGFAVASKEIREAREDLSRRPEPDLSGAIHHAMAALESVSRKICGDQKATLGEIVKQNPDLFPRPVDDAVSKLWGFASEQGRHGKESRRLEWAESLLVVGIAGSLCSYLINKFKDV